MQDIMLCLLIAAARYTLTDKRSKVSGVGSRVIAAFLHGPHMEDNPDIAYMYSGEMLALCLIPSPMNAGVGACPHGKVWGGCPRCFN